MLDISLSLAENLISKQFPEFSNLIIKPVKFGGHDNRTFRLGNEMLIRLPSSAEYADSVKKEQKWLPILAKSLSFQIPTPLKMGIPSANYPYCWSIYNWIEGESLNLVPIKALNLEFIALELAKFLNELHKIDVMDAPISGIHNFYRGGSLKIYEEETRSAIYELKDFINVNNVIFVWNKAVSSLWDKQNVWVHGDLAIGNILINDKKLAIIDFGCMGVGDPACDLAIAYTLFKNESRQLFRNNLPFCDKIWDRAKGWVLWKALITMCEVKNSIEFEKNKQIIEDIIAD